MNKQRNDARKIIYERIKKAMNKEKNSMYASIHSVITTLGSVLFLFSDKVFATCKNYKVLFEVGVILWIFVLLCVITKMIKKDLEDKKNFQHLNTNVEHPLVVVSNDLAYCSPFILAIGWILGLVNSIILIAVIGVIVITPIIAAIYYGIKK